ncbi:hypothetical protein ABH973_003810 [Bradyrhizobium ottawaense]
MCVENSPFPKLLRPRRKIEQRTLLCLRFGLSWRRSQRIRDVPWASHASESGKDTFLLQIGRRDRTILSVCREPARVASLAADCRQSQRAKGVRTRVNRHGVSYDLEHHLIVGQQSLASALTHPASYQCCRRSLPPPQTSLRSFAGCRIQSLVSSSSELRRRDKCELALLLQGVSRRGGQLPTRRPAHCLYCRTRNSCLCADGITIHHTGRTPQRNVGTGRSHTGY